MASALVVEALAGGVAGLPEPVPQEGEVTLADKISTEDLHLDWTKRAVDLNGSSAWAGPGLPSGASG